MKIEEQSQKNAKEQSLLFANIAHDLKTPLTTIIGFSKALDDNMTSNPKEQEELLKIIHQKAIASNELLDLMFQYTKLKSDEFKLNLTKTDIGKLLRETVAEHYDLLEDYRIDLDMRFDEDFPVEVLIDRTEIKRSFANLIINACKHNPSNTLLNIELKHFKDYAYIVFKDNGNEIPKAKWNNLFQPFISESQRERDFSGSGLGLAITKSILDKHGFSIELKESSGGYTKEFVITMDIVNS